MLKRLRHEVRLSISYLFRATPEDVFARRAKVRPYFCLVEMFKQKNLDARDWGGEEVRSTTSVYEPVLQKPVRKLLRRRYHPATLGSTDDFIDSIEHDQHSTEK